MTDPEPFANPDRVRWVLTSQKLRAIRWCRRVKHD